MAPPGLAPGCHRSASSSSSPHLSFSRRWRPSFFSCSPSLYAASSYRFRRCHCSKGLKISSRNFEPPQLARPSQKAQQLHKDDNFVEVIAIGSRKDAVLDFCLNSPFQSNSLRFWNITVNDSVKVLLQQRLLSTDLSPITVEFEAFLKFPPKAVILVASAGYGSDHTPVIDIIRSVRSANGFAISIFLKPFSFEGQRRQDEVSYLVGALQEHTNFCVDVDTDMLLKKDLVTLDEALKTANNAVLMATNTVSVLTHDLHLKHLAVLHSDTKELTALELFEVLQDYKKAKIGFGTGHNIRASMVQATYQCPFLNFPVKDLHGIVLCVVAHSYVNESMDPRAISDTFRQTTGYEGDVVISIIHEPVLEANLVVTTLVTLGSVRDGQQETHESSFFSRLAKRFPFVFNLLRKENPQPNGDQGKKSVGRESVEDLYVAEAGEGQFGIALDTTNEGSYVNDGVETFDKRNTIGSQTLFNSGQSDLEVLETSFETFENFSEASGETPAFQREPLNAWSFGPGYEVAQKWAKARAENVASTSTLDSVSIFRLPVGVRPSGELKDSVHMSSAEKRMEEDRDDDVKGLVTESSMSPWSGFTGASLGAVKDLYSVASTLIKGKDADFPKKQGVLSLRAASMLEAERDSPKKWNPIVEMQYRGGVYKGRCQGGLPEGKGGLVLRDGSIYEGMWRCGKRSGCGTFYFSNGDVFQGSWRDDLIHGKGWYYFQSGDRWFVNFWKGKPSGEGRFYSKSGEVVFGQFKDGWRHGRFMCIDVDGQRYVENWDDGVLVNREPQDSHT